MHISEGILSAPVLIGGAVLAIGCVGIGLKTLEEKKLPLCAVMASIFFAGSLVHVPIGFTNAHLLLCGLIGIFLGWSAFPAIFTALLLQALLFQYGGLTTLGINTFTMGTAAVCAWYIYRGVIHISSSVRLIPFAGFIAGFFSVAISAILTACALACTDESFKGAAYALLAAHLPIMIVEGIITGFTAVFISKIKPALLPGLTS